MSTEFLGSDIWSAIRTEAKQYSGKSFVAVAYFGTGAAKRLPLKKGSILVVDATDKAVKSGQTNPAELIKLRNKGVRIFSKPNLHAKVFVFGEVAFVGSTNVSENSEDVYSEASIRTNQTSVISLARQFVRSLAVNEIGPLKLASLLQKYVERKKSGSRSNLKSSRKETRFFISPMSYEDESEEDKTVIDYGQGKAKELISSNKTHRLLYFWTRLSKNPYRSGDSILPVYFDENRKVLGVEPPAEFLYSVRGKKRHYFYFEQLRRRGLSNSEFMKKMPSNLKKRLQGRGHVNREDEIAIRRVFSK